MAERNDLITENLGLVHSCCHRFVGRGVEYDDLYQAGCVGLIKAADRFEEERGLCFSTYAVPAILGEIKRISRWWCRKGQSLVKGAISSRFA